MKKTLLEDFLTELRQTGGYETRPENRAAVRAKPSAWATLRYSLGMFYVFPACAVSEPLGNFSVRRWIDFCFKGIEAAEGLGMNLKVEGFENRQKIDGPVMYLSNHMSMTETIILPPILYAFGPFSYVAKRALAHLPFLERAAAKTGMIAVGRVSPRDDLMTILKVGAERVERGESMLIFPEGTRRDVFSHAKYSSIGAKLAERAKIPIVPIVVDTRAQPTRKEGLLKNVFKDFGPVDTSIDLRVSCGPAILPARAKDMHEAAFDWMASKLESWGLPTER